MITACLTLGVGAAALQVVRAQDTPPPAAEHRVGALRTDQQGGCVAEYRPDTLDDQHWAADVTITDIDDGDRLVTVSVRVNHWYRGGSGSSAEVMLPNPEIAEGIPPAFGVGSRLLVSGAKIPDGYLAWTCGFSRYYDRMTAATWGEVFSS